MNSATAANFMRSAKAPTMSAGVIAAKVIWKQTYTSSEILASTLNVAALESGVTPIRNALEKPPMKSEPPVKARL